MPVPYYIMTAIYCLLIFLLSNSPELGTITLPFIGADKIIHVVLYAGLASIVSVGMRRSGKPVTAWSQCFIPIIFATLYGISDEFHQSRVKNRSCDPADALADMAGACFVQIFLCYVWWRNTSPVSSRTEP